MVSTRDQPTASGAQGLPTPSRWPVLSHFQALTDERKLHAIQSFAYPAATILLGSMNEFRRVEMQRPEIRRRQRFELSLFRGSFSKCFGERERVPTDVESVVAKNTPQRGSRRGQANSSFVFNDITASFCRTLFYALPRALHLIVLVSRLYN